MRVCAEAPVGPAGENPFPEERDEMSAEPSQPGSEDVELSLELQAEIRELARQMPELTYYELLGVTPDSDTDQLRQGFFERSKRLHPDRYFGKEIGPYGGLLTEIYRRIAVAHDVLRDPEMRKQYDRSTAKRDAAPASPPAAEAATEDAPPKHSEDGAAPPSNTPPGKSLRARRGLRPPDFGLRSLKARLQAATHRALAQFEEGKALSEQLQWSRAADKLRLAVTLDPRKADYQNALADVLARVNDQRMVELERGAERLIASADPSGALERFIALAELKPTDHALAARIAELLIEVRADVRGALGYARRAVDLESENAAYAVMLGRLLNIAGGPEAARPYFERALILDPENKEVKMELHALLRAAGEAG